MSKRQRNISIIVFISLIALLIAGIFIFPAPEHHGDIQQIMQNEVLHERGKISLFGLIDVNPGLISAFVVSAILIVFAIIVRIFVIPKFKLIPGKFQMLLEEAVGLFDNLAKNNSPHKSGFIGAYIFTAGAYIFISTIFELLGLQAINTDGASQTLPAPLADINGAIAMGLLSYGVILGGGLIVNGLRGAGHALKDFSLPISMSFRLFGAMLSGALVTELVYHYMALSFVLPVIVGVLFTLIHAVVQAYVLTMLTALFFGECTAPHEKHEKPKKIKKPKKEKKIK